MDTQKATEIFREQGYTVEKTDGGFLVDYPSSPRNRDSFYSPEELIKWARHYTSEGSPSWKKSLKHYDNRKNRRATKQMIDHEEWDDYPLQGKIKSDNPWNWD